MFTDMVGFTTATHRDEAGALERLREMEVIVRAAVRAHSGREVKSTGDGSLIELSSALKAVECAIAIQHQLHERNAAPDVTPIHLRIGVHVGDVEGHGADIFGDAVNIAARVLSVADPEGIALTEQVVHHVENKLGVPVESLGPRGLKGVDKPVPIFRVVLPWSGPATASQDRLLPRLAVLPLRNISPDPDDAYFADGLTEELIAVLGQVRELRVIGRSSAARFGGGARSLPEIGRELGASAVLEGSVRKAGERLRISLQLVDVATQEGLWTETFDRRLDDVFAVQTEVGERTAAALRVRIVGPGSPVPEKPPTPNLAAYGLYLQGLHRIQSSRPLDVATTAELFRRAIAEDPAFSGAYSRLANCLLGSVGETSPARKVIPQVRPLVEKALSLDPSSPEAHTANGNLAMQGDLDWSRAETEFRYALARNPSDADPRRWYALLLRALQRYGDAEEQARVMIELDPLTPGGPIFLASIQRLAGDTEAALRTTRTLHRPRESAASFHLNLAYTYFYAARLEETRRELGEELTAAGGQPSLDHDVLLARLGDPTGARRRLEEEERLAKQAYVPLVNLAALAAAVGDAERALAYLERDWSEGDRGLWYMYQGTAFDPIRSDPRFLRLLERYRLPTAAPFYRMGRRG